MKINNRTMEDIFDGLQSYALIKDVIFNDPATIVFWEDGTKTVVKATDEAFDPEKGLAMAISKKALGNKYDYFNVFKKWTKKYHKKGRNRTIKNAKDD